jgi:DNA-binding ferritin-like protein (Dps family)
MGAEDRLCSLEDVLEEVERVKAGEVGKVKSMEARVKISKSTYLIKFYCSKCLRVYEYTNNELRRRARKGMMLKCTYCHEELREVDEELKRRYEELWEDYRCKVEAILKPIWRTLRNWWIETDEERMLCSMGRFLGRYSVTVKFDAPSHLRIYLEDGEVKAYMYLHWFEPKQVEKFKQILEVLRNARVKALIEVDPRGDHCTVPREDMERLGFKMGLLDWQLELQP